MCSKIFNFASVLTRWKYKSEVYALYSQYSFHAIRPNWANYVKEE